MEKTIPIYRTTTSEYQDKDFVLAEQRALEGINAPGFKLKYVNDLPQNDFIMISNTLTQMAQIEQKIFDRVKLIVHPNSGYNNFTFNLVNQANFPIIIGSPIRAQAVSNYILSCLLNHFSNIPHHSHWKPNRHWNRKHTLNEMKILIIGLGHIGNILYKSLSPLCPNISIYDPYKGHPHFDVENIDIIIPACNLNETCKNLFNHNILSKLRSDVLIINAARGSIFHQKDLVNFLESHPEAFAYIDVFEKEPNSFESFTHLKNANLTSHIAGVYDGLDKKIIDFEQTIITDFLLMHNDLSQFNEKYQNILMNNRIINGILI